MRCPRHAIQMMRQRKQEEMDADGRAVEYELHAIPSNNKLRLVPTLDAGGQGRVPETCLDIHDNLKDCVLGHHGVIVQDLEEKLWCDHLRGVEDALSGFTPGMEDTLDCGGIENLLDIVPNVVEV